MHNVNQEIRSHLKQFRQPTKFLLAVSGGPDSQALLYAFPHVAKDYGHSCIAVGIDHGLREEAGSELDLAEKLAKYIEVPFFRHKIQLSKGPNLQARARAARYSALYDIANREGADLIVTAHHADDVVETTIFRLFRSGKIGALDAIQPLSGRLFRPLLNIRKKYLVKHCESNDIEFAVDSSNLGSKYDRNWIRNEILPAIRERFPDIDNKLISIANESREIKERLTCENAKIVDLKKSLNSNE